MEDSRSVQEFQILVGGHLAISNYWGGLVPFNVYGGYAPAQKNDSSTDSVSVCFSY